MSSQLTLGDVIRRSALRGPTQIAIDADGLKTPYGELYARSWGLSRLLIGHGVGRGDRVSVHLPNGRAIIETYLACHLLGAIAVPINTRLAASEIDYIVADARPSALVTDDHFPVPTSKPSLGLVLEPESDLYASAAGSVPPDQLAEIGRRDTGIVAEDPAFIMYTSGTTGRPKGAVLSHRNLVVNALSFAVEMQLSRDDVWLSSMPLFHIGALVGLYPFLMLGAPAVILPSSGFDPAETARRLSQDAATVCAFVPTQWRALLDQPNAQELLSGLRRGIWGAAPADEELLRDMNRLLPAGSVVCTFGQTEVCANATFLQPKDSLRKLNSIGRPALTVEYRIVDDEERDVPDGAVGEIVYRGPTVMAAYWDNPQATVDAFAGGWFHSGDLVREDHDGYLYLVDRKKDLLISGGENVYPAEVEQAMARHDAVREVAVVGVPHPKWGEVPKAFVVTGRDVSAEELRGWCRQHLATYKIPQEIVFVSELPRNATGKVLKKNLRVGDSQAIAP